MGKNLYITTALPYATALPHIGNSMDYLFADIWARYQRQNGRDVRFQIGTDEHGNKVFAKAASMNVPVQDFTDKVSENFKQFADYMMTTSTDFIRTTNPNHMAACQDIWKKLDQAGLIYKGKYEGWYCTGHEAFFTDGDVEKTGGICPEHKTPYERISEENYYLKCSAFTEKIREAITTKRMEIIPEFRAKEFLEMIKDGIQDVSISRPRKSLSWGIEVPGDPNQIMYVWIDALCNYLTVLGYPENESWRDYWPANVQVIGKDILRFHAGIWPAILLGIGVSLPKRLLVHGHVNVNGEKMSKTVGNIVSPVDILNQYGVDAFRYYFSKHVSTVDDGDFTWEKFENAYNNELGNDLGNLVQRVASMILRYQSGVIGDCPQPEHDMKPYHDFMENLEFDKAINEAWNSVHALNKYLEDVKPWEIAKKRESDTEAESHLAEVLAYASGVLLQVADMLTPFLPIASDKIHKIFETGVVPGSIEPIFPKIYLHTVDPRKPHGNN